MSNIEKIRAEIERRRLQNRYIDTDGYEQELFEIIDSLQQEQEEEPDKGLNVTDFCKPIDPGIAQCVADHWHEMLGEEEPDKSLDEEAEEWAENEAYGKSDAEFEMAYKGFIAGAKWQKQQMLKDAVEGEIHIVGFNNAIFIKEPKAEILDHYNVGDKVRIIIVKED